MPECLGCPHKYQYSNYPQNYVHQVEKPTADRENDMLHLHGYDGHHQESGQRLVEAFDGVEQTNQQTLHGVGALGTDILEGSSVEEHVRESRQGKLNYEQQGSLCGISV